MAGKLRHEVVDNYSDDVMKFEPPTILFLSLVLIVAEDSFRQCLRVEIVSIHALNFQFIFLIA